MKGRELGNELKSHTLDILLVFALEPSASWRLLSRVLEDEEKLKEDLGAFGSPGQKPLHLVQSAR